MRVFRLIAVFNVLFKYAMLRAFFLRPARASS